MQGERVVERPQRHQVLAVVEGEAADTGLSGPPERLVEQPVGVGVVPRADVVGLLEEDGIDVCRVHELAQVHDLPSLSPDAA